MARTNTSSHGIGKFVNRIERKTRAFIPIDEASGHGLHRPGDDWALKQTRGHLFEANEEYTASDSRVKTVDTDDYSVSNETDLGEPSEIGPAIEHFPQDNLIVARPDEFGVKVIDSSDPSSLGSADVIRDDIFVSGGGGVNTLAYNPGSNAIYAAGDSTEYSDGGTLAIVDYSDPSNPSIGGKIQIPGSNVNYSECFEAYGEFDTDILYCGGYLYDISESFNPLIVGVQIAYSPVFYMSAPRAEYDPKNRTMYYGGDAVLSLDIEEPTPLKLQN
jgi:hypothetical protein